MKRRKFISTGLGASLATGMAGLYPWESGWAGVRPNPKSETLKAIDEKAYLEEILYTREEVRSWLAGEAFPFSKYHPRFGWLLNNASFQDGIDDSISVYTYAETEGERLMSNHRDKTCRINTYGNSFTQCHQVSDHETWQEVLAAHLQEPVRNYGIGGWSVYQAYLRMLKEEEHNPAPYIIFNIYEDDHRRNLDSWRNIRVRKHPQHIESPLPHVKVDMAGDRIIEFPNPCSTPESLYDLCDIDKSLELFREDFVLQIMLAHRNSGTMDADEQSGKLSKLILTHGIETRTDQGMSLDEQASSIHWEAAWFSSRKIVDKILEYAKQKDKQILWVLSYPGSTVARHLQEKEREDQSFVNFLREKDQPVVDLMDWHRKDFSQHRLSVESYIDKYFIGHYNPLGNFSCAMALKEFLVGMLDPLPAAYLPMGKTSL